MTGQQVVIAVAVDVASQGQLVAEAGAAVPVLGDPVWCRRQAAGEP